MNQHKISLALAFLQTHPDKAAAILECHEAREVADFLSDIPHSYATCVLRQMLPQRIAQMCKQLKQETVASLILDLEPNRIAAILRHLSKDERNKTLQELPAKAQINCKILLNYSRDSIGAWMTPQYIAIPDDAKVADAIAYTQVDPKVYYTDFAWVVDREQKLKGRIRLAELVTGNAHLACSAIMEEDVLVFSGRTPLYHLANHPCWNTYEAVPVLNKSQQLVGIFRHIDLRQGLEKQSNRSDHTLPSEAPLTGLIRIYGHTLKTLMITMKECIEADLRD